MKYIYYSLFSFALWLAIPVHTSAKSDNEVSGWTVEKIDDILERASHQALILAKNLEGDSTALPTSFIDGKVRTTSYQGWVCGFFPGTLWMLSEQFPQNEELRRYAEMYTKRVEPARNFKDNHDIGFMLNCSFGQAYRVTRDTKYLFPLFDGAKNLSERFMPGAGVTLSWSRNDKWRNPVIIDNMMNLELLEFVGQKQNNQTYLDIADTHAHTTMKNHYRPNYSTWHVIDYDEVTGEVLHRNTAQGYSDESDWARGQAWGLYGFTMMYQMTGRSEYLTQASHVGNYLLTRSNMPEDLVPYWDYDCPDIPNTIRDASSASIMASAFLQLSLLDAKKSSSHRWMQAACKQLSSLSSEAYTAKPGEMGGFILMHSTGSVPHKSEMDVPLSYADYYYVEALLRLKRILSNSSLAASRNLPIEIYQASPMTKVLSCETEFTDHKDTLHVARGENAVFQFVITSSQDLYDLKAQVNNAGLGEVRTGWLHDVYSGIEPKDADDMIVSPDKTFPDPIIDDHREALNAKDHKTVCVDIDIPRDATPGLHKCSITIEAQRKGKVVKTKKNFFVKVYPVTLPEEQQLKVVNWFDAGLCKFMNNGVLSDKDPLYFDFIRQIAETGARYGQNCWLMNVKPEIVLTADKKDFRLDFTTYDKIMDILIQYGNLKYVCNGHLGGRTGSDWSSPMGYHITRVENGELVKEFVGHEDPKLPVFIQKYFSQLEAHLREKGWLEISYQHIADEPEGPGTISQQSWTAAAQMVKKAAPGLRTIDASSQIIEDQDVSVILLGGNIATMPPVPEGSERWLYTCCFPQGKFANRFIQLPLIKTRILHWLNYRYNEVGYLHWGMNVWHLCPDPNFDVTTTISPWPGGDTHIIYPGYHKIYPSIRLCTMRDGIRDYELLKMVEAVNPEKAMELSSKIILGAFEYNTDVNHFMGIRRQILEFLSNRPNKQTRIHQ